jgi:hypothetical protein
VKRQARLVFILLVTLMLASCGGGSQHVDYMPPAPQALRRDLFFGYYLTFNDQIRETGDHVNLVHESGWFGVDATAISMRAHGKPTMLDVSQEVYEGGDHARPRADLEARLGATLDALKTAGVLSQVRALYPMDEPENMRLSDGAITATNARIRKVATKYPELAAV